MGLVFGEDLAAESIALASKTMPTRLSGYVLSRLRIILMTPRTAPVGCWRLFTIGGRPWKARNR